MPRLLKVLVLVSALPLCRFPATAQRGYSQTDFPLGRADRVTPYIATPQRVVERMLEIAQVGPDDVVYDLGSGDGRIVITAAEKFGARAVGVEIDEKLYEESADRIARLGLGDRAKIVHGNMFETDLRPATVVTLYQLTVVNERLRPILEKQLRRGARVVSNEFRITGWEPQKTVAVTSDAGVGYTLYLYVRP